MRPSRMTKETAVRDATIVYFGHGQISKDYTLRRITKEHAMDLLVHEDAFGKLCVMIEKVPEDIHLHNTCRYRAIIHYKKDCPGAPDVWLNVPDGSASFDIPTADPVIDGRIKSAINTLKELAPEKLNTYI